jgi:hypothetical protein
MGEQYKFAAASIGVLKHESVSESKISSWKKSLSWLFFCLNYQLKSII